jgi:hypothetical protein
MTSEVIGKGTTITTNVFQKPLLVLMAFLKILVHGVLSFETALSSKPGGLKSNKRFVCNWHFQCFLIRK